MAAQTTPTRRQPRVVPRPALPLGALAVLGALAMLTLAGCQHKAPPAAGEPTGGRPFPELPALLRIVKDTRAILPRVPEDTTPRALPESATAQGPAARRVLVGTGRLLRPSDFRRLPGRVSVALFLDDRSPPGGRLAVTAGESRTAVPWPLLPGYTVGPRDGNFTFVFPVRDPAYRLWYFVLLGVHYEAGGRRYRSFEGYLILPAEAGPAGGQPAVYPIDFGYQWPEQPALVAFAHELRQRMKGLQATHEHLRALLAEQSQAEKDAESLRNASISSDKEAQRRRDLADYARRIARLKDEAGQARETLRSGLETAYHARAQLAQAWVAYTDTNAYRWRSPAGQRALYEPLAGLRRFNSTLEAIYAEVGGEQTPALRKAREAMTQAVLREAELAPAPPAR